MTRYHFSLNNRNNFAFIKDNTIDFYTVDLIDLTSFFYKLEKNISYEYKGLIKEISYQYNKIGLFNNLKRTKSYTIFNVLTLIYKARKYYITLNILPKNLNIINYREVSNVNLNNALKKLSYDIYSTYKVFNNSINKKLSYKENECSNIVFDNYIIEYSLLKKILLEVYKLETTKKISIKTIKSSNTIGINNFVLNEIYKPKDGFIQDIIEKKEIFKTNYLFLLKKKLEEYNSNIDKYNLKQNIFILNQIINIMTNKTDKINNNVFLLKTELDRLSSDVYIEKLFKELYKNKLFDNEGVEVITTNIYDMSTIWEKFLENILRKYETASISVYNGNKTNKLKKNYLFTNEYELKYDFIVSETNNVTKEIKNDIIDAKYKLPKKNYKNEILYDGNDARQVYIYLQSYNLQLLDKPLGILIYPSVVDIDISRYKLLSFEQLQDESYEKFKKVFNNKKKYSLVGLKGYELLFKEIDFFNIQYL